MVVHLRDSFLSIVRDRHEADRLVVRGCLEGDIERVFPGTIVIVRPDTRFRYRAFVAESEVARVLSPLASAIDYESFSEDLTPPTRRKGAVVAEESMLIAQGKERFPIEPGGRMCVIRKDWQTVSFGSATTTVPLDVPVSPDVFGCFRLGLLPVEMEDKWFLFFEDPYLYLHRSWTGFLAGRLKVVPWTDRRKIVECKVNMDREKFKWTDPMEGATACLDVVMHTLLMLPVKSSGPADAISAWGSFGQASLGEGPSPGKEYKPESGSS